ncbi:DUF523 domain-containing protein [Acinetobacter sp. ANC 3832]|uniref:DUF523 domain-containing protein n=1 Tax=Acinetobacter sp. ANC 3832 TaxID=1977874 RepID=UPI000A3559F7|nr:DUF523 domain-containing protein [Acinetobacter sp. ANC 3832]OTG95753.1 hypothetical protein B9T35_04230 [Acinetobacter sp. ANC 3832]
MPKYLISACLVGENVRYDGQNCLQQKLRQLVIEQRAVIICPEVLGGLSTPRLAAEIVGGNGEDVLCGKAKVLDSAGNDVSNAFIQGAYKALQLAQKHQITHVILKANSPSCGSELIYDGSFSGNKIQGNGVTSALLKQHGFTVITEDQFLQILDI